MARNIDLNIVVTEEGAGADKAAASLDKTAAAADRMGTSFQDASKKSGMLDQAIADTEAKIKRLLSDIDTQGADKAIVRDLAQSQGWLKKLTQIKGQIQDEARKAEEAAVAAAVINPWKGGIFGRILGGFGGGEAVRAGEKVAADVGKGFLSTITKFGKEHPLATLLVGAAPALVPMAGSLLFEALGLGGMAAGIVASHNDPRVQAAWQQTMQDAKGKFKEAAASFPPAVVESLNIIDASIQHSDMKSFFEQLAVRLPGLAHGIADATSQFIDHSTKALQQGGDILDEFSKTLPDLGAALGGFFEHVANSTGSREAMHDLVEGAAGFVRLLGRATEILGDIYHDVREIAGGPIGAVFGALGDTLWYVNQGAKLVGDEIQGAKSLFEGSVNFFRGKGFNPYADITSTAKTLGPLPQLMGANQALDTTRNKIQGVLDAWKGLTDEFHAKVDPKMQAQRDLIAFQKGLDDLTASIKENGKTLDINTEKGRANKTVLLDLITDAIAIRDDMYAAGDPKAAARFDALIKQIEKLAKTLGLSDVQVQALLTDLGVLSNTTVAPKLKITLPSVGAPHQFRDPETRAGGGQVYAGLDYKVGEYGVERVRFPAGGRVLPTGRSGGGGTRAPIVITDPFLNMAFQAIREAVRSQGGGDVQAFFGQAA